VRLRWRAAGATHTGRVRKGNEDSFVLDSERGVFLVADGMGGHAAGEIASAIAADTIGGALRDGVDRGLDADGLAQVMIESFRDADRKIGEHVAEHAETYGMGTTATAVVLCTDGTYRLGNVGDSRAYLQRDGVLAQLSRDHTWVQREVDEGRLTPAGARRHHLSHILTRALGADPLDTADLFAGHLLPGDRLLLCSDGLTGMLTDRDLSRVLASDAPPEERVARLIRGANVKGGRDNITALLVVIDDVVE
jgi:serine/threonine protein phosphatase PrpC